MYVLCQSVVGVQALEDCEAGRERERRRGYALQPGLPVRASTPSVFVTQRSDVVFWLGSAAGLLCRGRYDRHRSTALGQAEDPKLIMPGAVLNGGQQSKGMPRGCKQSFCLKIPAVGRANAASIMLRMLPNPLGTSAPCCSVAADPDIYTKHVIRWATRCSTTQTIRNHGHIPHPA